MGSERSSLDYASTWTIVLVSWLVYIALTFLVVLCELPKRGIGQASGIEGAWAHPVLVAIPSLVDAVIIHAFRMIAGGVWMFYFSHLTAMAAAAVLSHLLTDAIPSACFIIITCVLGVVPIMHMSWLVYSAVEAHRKVAEPTKGVAWFVLNQGSEVVKASELAPSTVAPSESAVGAHVSVRVDASAQDDALIVVSEVSSVSSEGDTIGLGLTPSPGSSPGSAERPVYMVEADAQYKFYCPICMLYYLSIYKTKCCEQYVCNSCTRDLVAARAAAAASVPVPPPAGASLDCPYCSVAGLALARVARSEIARRYEDSPDVRKEVRSLCLGVQPSPLKVGDSLEAMVKKMVTYDEVGYRLSSAVAGSSADPYSTPDKRGRPQGLPPPMPGVLEGEEVRMSLMQEPPLQLNFAARSIGQRSI